jgi:hypothetical protein
MGKIFLNDFNSVSALQAFGHAESKTIIFNELFDGVTKENATFAPDNNQGDTYYVEEVRTGKKELATATMWVIENGEPQNSPPYPGNEKMLSKNAPSALTSETLSHDKGTNNSETTKENL